MITARVCSSRYSSVHWEIFPSTSSTPNGLAALRQGIHVRTRTHAPAPICATYGFGPPFVPPRTKAPIVGSAGILHIDGRIVSSFNFGTAYLKIVLAFRNANHAGRRGLCQVRRRDPDDCLGQELPIARVARERALGALCHVSQQVFVCIRERRFCGEDCPKAE